MKKRHSAEQIVGLLRQADDALGKGEQVPEVCKRLGVSQQTYYRWRTKCGISAHFVSSMNPKRTYFMASPRTMTGLISF
jgi:putative transposase